MPNRSGRIAFIKALIAAAWADGELSDGEIRTLSFYLQRFRITDREYQQIKPLLGEALTPEQAQQLLEEQVNLLSKPEEQRTLVGAVEDLLVVDDTLDPREAAFLNHLRRLTQNLPTAHLFISRMRTLWAAPPPVPPQFSIRQGRQEVAHFLQKRRLEAFRCRLSRARSQSDPPEQTFPEPAAAEQAATEQAATEQAAAEQAFSNQVVSNQAVSNQAVSDRELHQAIIWAALLTQVAQSDDTFCPEEKEELKAILARSGAIPLADLEVIAKACHDGTLVDLNIEYLVQEFLQVATPEDASALLDGLFLLAAADGRLHQKELATIRRIAGAAGIPEQAFRLAQKRCEQRMREGWN